MLKVEDVSIAYGPVRILSNLTFDVNVNEIVAIIGPNGHGKTTLLKGIARLNDITSGRIRYLDSDITALKPHDVVRLGITLMPEGGGVLPGFTVIENLKLGSWNNWKEQNKMLEQAYSVFPWLAQRKNQVAWTLSGGERRMLAIARCLMGSPRLFLMDEPTLGIAPIVQQQLREALMKIRVTGRSLVIAESNVSFVRGLADRILLLKDNRLAEVKVEELTMESATRLL
jgi:branched-chain amino acid transport system ATP-binding protein